MYLSALCRHFEKKLNKPVTMDMPFADLPPEVRHAILYGCPDKMEVVYEREFAGGRFLSDFEGIINNLERRYKESTSDWSKGEIEGYMSRIPCPACRGSRARRRHVRVERRPVPGSIVRTRRQRGAGAAKKGAKDGGPLERGSAGFVDRVGGICTVAFPKTR